MSAAELQTETEATAKYEPIMELGHGGTSDVYLAVARGMGGFNKLVVLKALKRNLADEDRAREMFLTEARISARLNHPNIVQVNEVTEQEGVPIIVMEYLEGRSLAHVLAEAGAEMALPLQLRTLADALAGLHYAHELTDFDGTPLGLVHRDVSPHNVFVTFDGNVKLLDFGIAKLSAHASEMTRTGVVKGKLHYMSPEQVVGDKRLDRRADLFAVGVMLWEAATGERLWKAAPEPTIIARLLDGDLPSPRAVRPNISDRLERTIMRALARDAAQRYATADELRRDVEAVISELSGYTSNRDLGKFVSKVFAESRAATKRLIDKRLRDESTMSLSSFDDLPPASQFSNPALTTTSTTRAVVPARAPQKAGAPKWIAGVAIALLLSGAALWYRISALESGTAAPATAAPAVAAAPERVRLRVTAYPVQARLKLDGVTLDSNPYDADVPVDQKLHQLTAEAPGFQSASRELSFVRNIEIVLNLQRVPAAPASTPKAESAPPPAPAPVFRGRPAPPAEAAPKKQSAECTPPYYIDERGVKKYKPNCL